MPPERKVMICECETEELQEVDNDNESSPRLQCLMSLNIICHCATRTKSKDFVKCETEELQIVFCLAIGEFVFHITEESVCSPRQ